MLFTQSDASRSAGRFGDFSFLFEALCKWNWHIYAESFGAALYHSQDYRNREIDVVVKLPDGQRYAFFLRFL